MNQEIPQIDPKAEAREAIYNRVRDSLADIFDSGGGQERFAEIRRGIANSSEYLSNPIEQVLLELEKICQTSDKQEFIDKIFEILKPIADLKVDHPDKFEIVARQIFLEAHDIIPVNQLIAYSIKDGILELHIPPNEATAMKDKLSLLREGLHKIAKIVKADEKIEKVSGVSSWIVAKNPKLLERLGFKVIDIPPDETGQLYQDEEQRDLRDASMTREDFLKKYG